MTTNNNSKDTSSKKSASAVKTIILMMAATFLAKFLGLLRTVLFGYHYGMTEVSEAFSAALSIPRACFDVLFSAAIAGCFVPVYTSFLKSKDTSTDEEVKEADNFACIFFNVILLIAGSVSLLGIIFAEPIIHLITPNMTPEMSRLAVSLIRILFPTIALSAGTYTLVGVLQSKDSFLIPAFLSAISNAGVIIYFIFIDRSLGGNGIYGLAAAYLLSWVVQLLTLVIPLVRSGFKFKFIVDFKNPALIQALKSIPTIFVGSWLIPIASVLGTTFADKLDVYGAIALFDYSNTIYLMIAGILTHSICNFLLPKLSRLSVSGDEQEFRSSVREGVYGSLMIVIPMMFAIFVLAGEGISILRGGEFTVRDAELSSHLIAVVAVGMPAFSIIEFGSRVFYAKRIFKAPAVAALTGVIVNAASTSVLIASGASESLGISTLGIGNMLGQSAAALVLIIFAAVKIKGLINKELILSIIKIILCSVLAYLVMIFVHRLTGDVPYELSRIRNIITAVIVFVSGAAVYIGLMFGIKKFSHKIKNKN